MASYTLSPVGGAGAQFFDNNGNILSGGKLYTYAAGTTTPQTTWTTPSGSTANTNPVILDSAGRPPQEIWLSAAYSYKFALKTSTDVLIATYDNVPGLPQPAIVNDASSISYEQGNTVTAGSFVVGRTYMIASSGNTDFVAIGAAANTAGIVFVATGAGSGTGTAYNSQTVAAKLQQTVSVKDFGAVGDGVTDDTAAFTAAGAASNNLVVPQGTYLLSSTPALNNVLLNVNFDAVLTGAGAAALGYTAGAGYQTLQVNASSGDFSSRYIRRDASYTGGTPGYVCGALKVRTFVGAAATSYEWGIVGICDNSATAGQNVGIYAQGIRRGAVVGPTFGAVAEVYDPTGQANPAFSMVGLEVDCRGNGTDNNNNRIGIDVVLNKQDAGGADNVVSYGVRVQNGGDATALVKTAFAVTSTASIGFDASAATIQQAAFKMATNQTIAFNATALNQFGYDGVGLKYTISGAAISRLNDDGSIGLNGTRLVVKGTWNTGSQTPIIGANKPGATGGAPAQWLSITIDGNQHWIPAWAN